MMTMKNNIPVGYKDSAVGVIPQEWEVRTFQELGSMLGTNTLSRDKMNECSGCAQNIHYGDVLVKYGEVLDCTSMNIPWVNSDYGNANLGTNLQNGDVVISDTAEDHTVGKATEVQGVGKKIVLSGLHTIAFRPNAGMFAPNFLGYYFNSTIYRAQLYPLIQGIKVCSISKKAISNTKLTVPPIAEQRKIAEILGVWDEAIEMHSRLIEKLELRKRALMQRLLTGRTRLPGFNTPWQKRRMKDCFEHITDTSNGCEYLPMTISARLGLISQKDKFDRVIAGDSLKKYTHIQKGDFAYNKGNSNLYEMGCIYRLKEQDAVVPFVYICFRPKQNVIGEFYQHFFINHGLDRQLKRIITSGARGDGLLNVDKSDFFELEIVYPPIAEQKTIAEVLTAADNEITTHRKKLDALRLQKRGLMQQLLTGKTRVKI